MDHTSTRSCIPPSHRSHRVGQLAAAAAVAILMLLAAPTAATAAPRGQAAIVSGQYRIATEGRKATSLFEDTGGEQLLITFDEDQYVQVKGLGSSCEDATTGKVSKPKKSNGIARCG